jgi:hypothetical protein
VTACWAERVVDVSEPVGDGASIAGTPMWCTTAAMLFCGDVCAGGVVGKGGRRRNQTGVAGESRLNAVVVVVGFVANVVP